MLFLDAKCGRRGFRPRRSRKVKTQPSPSWPNDPEETLEDGPRWARGPGERRP